jgi:hypothetical protein
VFDNAEDPADLRPWWPPASGRVLVTSRNPAWAGLAATIPLDVLPRGEAISFLQRRLGRDDPAVEALAAELEDLPLALDQAAAYLDETATAVADYLDLLRDRAQELFALGRPATTEQTIATTWRVSLLRLRSQSPVAEDLLVLCAFLAPENIPRNLLTDHPDVLPAPLAAAVRDRLGVQQAVAALRRYSLVTVTEETLGLHRLVQAVTRQQLAPEQVQQRAAVALELTTAAFPQHPGNPATWPWCARLLPHVLTVCDHADASETEPDATAGLLTEVARYLWSRAELHKRPCCLSARLPSARLVWAPTTRPPPKASTASP